MATNDGASAARTVGAAARPGADVQTLYERRATQLWAFGRRLGLSAEQAEDAVQEAFARLVRTTRQEGMVRQPEPWLFRTVNNLAMDQHRRANRVREIEPLGDDGGDRTALASNLDGSTDTAMDLWAAVDRLPRRQRAAVYLRYRADFDFATIGRILSISQVGARANVFRALASLRREVER